MNLIDRRLNTSGKSLANRQRFLRRARALVKQAVRDSSRTRGVRDIDQGGEISIPVDGLREPRFHHAAEGGKREVVLPGNKKYLQGDSIEKDKAGAGGGGSDGSPDGDGQDEFRFVLSQAEYLDLFFEDLELPDLAKRSLAAAEQHSPQRAGYAMSGSPTNLSLTRTMRNSMSRRVALRRPTPQLIEALEEKLETAQRANAGDEDLAELRAELDRVRRRGRRIPFIDPSDVRFRRYQAVPKPVAQAVMFCLMDTSASMTEHMKDVAKRFFTLLYIFLNRQYRHVDIVFIRHTHTAEEVDEETFFGSPETGGTLVSSALEEMHRIIGARYPTETWNIYAAQASDGDNSSRDGDKAIALLQGSLLPLCQYFAYLEVGGEGDRSSMGFLPRKTELWRTYESIQEPRGAFAMRKVSHRSEIYPVFRDLFERRSHSVGTASA